ncbi:MULTISPECIES: L-arabinose ABC transporter ATP-binding protein AraG [unclassified Oceanispirochaeta]|uniref:L-arabinose ABC transporter ATP-binding protein AraG n=1 Tax=unclassified Oceanispirochaeta TaxID=2635722 RepID=UPI000E0970EA|nr:MULTISPECIES: L-arabinose ABC transporter ATP-binding protein AraG [unclassified Oceanispirochaeta]MBF9014196.1 L-arabinose ABC transporter ATP-binding protein AraG [Oceanispirochaeta sp. M2]NPD70686.1 L-arabinose ABC transporter ATP-binding protein AraG [Oceanispirochaeta sp. M1]RDG34446.1 ATP-binding cassette domain-containing protein [Oceanispirochaeta sp. M1]
MTAYLEFKSVSKQFPGVKALDDVSFSVQSGEVHGLIGENGAGKSTLLKILSGAYFPSEGSVYINSQAMDFQGTKDALDAGVAIIYQELNLVPEMTVAENLLLGHFPRKKSGFIDFKKMKEIAGKELSYILEEINPDQKIKNLSIGQRQMIEIAKALLHNADIIAFDEPTSSLSDKETIRLFEIIRNLQKAGKAIIYVSHRMEEIFKICSTVTVFRDGKKIETFTDMSKVNHDILVSRMVGRDIKDVYSYRSREQGETILEVNDIMGPGISKPASFSLKKGEILGFFGLVGAGRSELMRLLYGAEKHSSGTFYLENEQVKVNSPKAAIERGMFFCPEDRKDDGIIPIRSVNENINISVRRHSMKAGFFLDKKKERETTDSFINKLQIKTPNREKDVGSLSGGNQQKVILARWLAEDVKILIMDEPTRGIDVGTKNEIYQLMYQLTEEGKSIICVSSDLPEVMGVSDRLIVMRDGELVTSFERDEFSEEKILSKALPDKAEE